MLTCNYFFGDKMIECPECGSEIDEEKEEAEFECPECHGLDYGEGFFRCEDCGTLLDLNEEYWHCIHCYDEFGFEGGCRCPQCGEPLEDESHCFCCGWPNNQGWIGENYG